MSRERKRKCIVQKEGERCTLCASKGLQCSSASRSANAGVAMSPHSPDIGSHASPSSANSFPVSESINGARSLDSALILDEALRNELVDLYFTYMHDTQHALFHRPTFIMEQRQGRAPLYLVYAMMALAARYSLFPLSLWGATY